MNKKEKTLSWDDFQSLGNPENAPPMEEDHTGTKGLIDLTSIIRVYLDRKRGGKIATVIKGFADSDDTDELKAIAKSLKLKLGVGGNYKQGQIILQGENRNAVIDFLKALGYKNVKAAGG
jgi:translation initiation factor 1